MESSQNGRGGQSLNEWRLRGGRQTLIPPAPGWLDRANGARDELKKNHLSSEKHGFSRRELLRATGLGLVGLTGADLVCASPARAAEPNPIKTTLEPLNRFPRMVQEYFVERLQRFETTNRKAKAALKNKAYQSFSQGLARLGYVVFI